MHAKGSKKRVAQAVQNHSKRRKLANTTKPDKAKSKSKGKERASDRATIPIPHRVDEDDVQLSEDDLGLLNHYGGAVSFLQTLDEKGIARSKKETERLHLLHKPVRKPVKDVLSLAHSHSEDEDEWSSRISDMSGASEDEDIDMSTSDDNDANVIHSTVVLGDNAHRKRRRKLADSDDDLPLSFEEKSRKPRASWEPDSGGEKVIERLPIKLADGRVQKAGSRVILHESAESGLESDQESDHHSDAAKLLQPVVEDVATGARFGRQAIVDVIGHKSRKARIQSAKEQIAGLCQDILGDPENSLGLMRRLHTFSLSEISTPTHTDPVPNDVVIRKLTMLSQLSVFKDIIPGYRIRSLTDKEKSEKVSQMVQRTRDWEQGLVNVYQTYLRGLEAELKARSELAEAALHCMCALLVEATHFNFRVNLMSSIVAALSRKSWDQSSDLCLETLIKVFRADNTGEPSLEIVRLLNRMVKERKYNVHPDVLSCLFHLRLKSELGVRASETKADKETSGGKPLSKGRASARRAKGKTADQPHLSKKARKADKERKDIEKEMHEAAAEVDYEERAARHTETLKLLFVLYFSILKNPRPTPLLPAALRGIAKYAHLVNVDFFKDLLQVLKTIMFRSQEEGTEAEEPDNDLPTGLSRAHSEMNVTVMIQHQLLCIVTAFELLSGQGEALDIDLSAFINHLYALLPALALNVDIETAPHTLHVGARVGPPPQPADAHGRPSPHAPSPADVLFRALALAFAPRGAARAPPTWRSAAFAKRLLGAALQWPPAPAVRALEFVSALVERDPRLAALCSTEERADNGVYHADVDDPQMCNALVGAFWELRALAETHWAEAVRVAARRFLEAQHARHDEG